MQQQGVDFFAAKDFIENKGLNSMNPNVLLQNINNPQYNNPLKVHRAPPQQP